MILEINKKLLLEDINALGEEIPGVGEQFSKIGEGVSNWWNNTVTPKVDAIDQYTAGGPNSQLHDDIVAQGKKVYNNMQSVGQNAYHTIKPAFMQGAERTSAAYHNSVEGVKEGLVPESVNNDIAQNASGVAQNEHNITTNKMRSFANSQHNMHQDNDIHTNQEDIKVNSQTGTDNHKAIAKNLTNIANTNSRVDDNEATGAMNEEEISQNRTGIQNNAKVGASNTMRANINTGLGVAGLGLGGAALYKASQRK